MGNQLSPPCYGGSLCAGTGGAYDSCEEIDYVTVDTCGTTWLEECNYYQCYHDSEAGCELVSTWGYDTAYNACSIPCH